MARGAGFTKIYEFGHADSYAASLPEFWRAKARSDRSEGEAGYGRADQQERQGSLSLPQVSLAEWAGACAGPQQLKLPPAIRTPQPARSSDFRSGGCGQRDS